MSKHRNIWIVFAAVLITGMGLIRGAGAQEAAETESPAVSADAMAVLKRALARFDDADEMAFTIDAEMVVTMRGQTRRQETATTVTLRRPDHLAVRHSRRGSVISDGDKLMRVVPRHRIWAEEDAPESIGGVLTLEGPGRVQGPALLLGPWLSPDLSARWLDAVTHLQPLEDADSEADVATYRVTIAPAGYEGMGLPGRALTFDVAIDTAEAPVIQWVRPDVSSLSDRPIPEGVDFSMTLRVSDFEARAADADFEFSPGPAMKKVASIEKGLEAVRQARQQGQGGRPAHALVGQAAPDFTVNTLEGEAFSLSNDGPRIVVLDFWATWCGPCVRAMPKLQEIHKWATAEGLPVAVKAVNLRETPAKVKNF
ncbi:MAG: redoxin domain-containing protein, partial [Phycisphaeraceae bacterium]|nr:redoxin domain-containing protein [Phycisphaeraceae bacterium]